MEQHAYVLLGKLVTEVSDVLLSVVDNTVSSIARLNAVLALLVVSLELHKE